ncbi:TRAP-type mannitol/chloroaromatic compound transport system permease small subunit [Chitinivorax tropicus]|uniref:TRAP transporter small permease protein n=1 Tax=Chitinivorax tropicus TaxID=714531 RepID=A0A840MPN1_9PROT|nr:TRAP transporter small permease subunit [Chitinivorax tropicus]MBB5018987.1 TRAP-type mannitol/chloroaromatic compound transport system permease small subunit [Chitinivorax tropicus]
MKFLLQLSRWIDAVTEFVGKSAMWLVLMVVLISAGNAIIRKAFDISSNAFLEIQWYLFSAIFLLGAAYTLLRNEHIRIDVIVGRLSPRQQAWVDILGAIFFLLPMACLIVYYSWPFVTRAIISNEMSPDAGGLIRWPVWVLIPAGFGLLILQACSEIIKRIAFLQDLIPNPADSKSHAPQGDAS